MANKATAVVALPNVRIGPKIKSGSSMTLHKNPSVSAIKGGKTMMRLRFCEKLMG